MKRTARSAFRSFTTSGNIQISGYIEPLDIHITDTSWKLSKVELTPSINIDVNININADMLRGYYFWERELNVSRRMHRTSFQGRLGRRLDNINIKIMDNSIRLSAHPTDMIRIKADRDDRSRDLLSRTIIDAEIVPIILPTMKDIPLRKFTREGQKDVLIPSLYPIANSEYFEIYTPQEVQLDEDDLLLRLIYEKYCDEPYVMALQVKDILSTIGYSSILYNKLQVTFYDEELPSEVIKLIKEANLKRETLGW